MKHVVKRKGHQQPFDQKKVYASVYAAALNCHYKEEQAEQLASTVTKQINQWIQKRELVSSEQIKEQIKNSIQDKDVVLMYSTHLDLC